MLNNLFIKLLIIRKRMNFNYIREFLSIIYIIELHCDINIQGS